MRKSLHALAAIVAATMAFSAQGQVVISQVNGNGGLSGDPLDRDFVELFNRGSTSVNLTGWSLQMFSDTGTASTPATPNWTMLPLTGTILPGQYLLVVPVITRGGLGAAFAIPPLPPADILATDSSERNLNSSANAVALLNTTATLASGECPVGRSDFVDMVRYGLSNAICFEGAGPALGIASGVRTATRIDAGCFDANISAADVFTNQIPAPRNSAVNAFVSSTLNIPTVTTGTSTPVRVQAARMAALCNPMGSALTSATANLGAFGLSASQPLFDDASNGDVSAGDGTFSFEFTVPASQGPGRYDIAVSGSNGMVTLPSTAVVRVLPAPATNDLCASATALSGSGVIFSGLINTSLATPDADAGTCNGDTETKFSVWFTYTPATTGAIRVDELSSEDIVTSIFTACGAASSVCQRNDIGSFIPVAAGVPVWIQVGHETGSTIAPQVALDLTLTFESAPANDEPCGAVTIPLNSPLNDSPNAAATAAIETGIGVTCDQGAAPPEARRGVWYTITTGSVGGNLEFLERSTNFSVMTVFNVPTCAGPFTTEVACIGESSTGPIVPLLPNSTYFVLVSLSTFSIIPSQPYDLTLTFFTAPDNDLACGAEAITTLPTTRTVQAKGATLDPSTSTTSACTGSANRLFGVWYTYTSGPAESGVLHIFDTSPNDLFYVSYTGPDCNALVPYQCFGAVTNDDIYITLQPSTRYWILVSLESTTGTPLPNGPYQLNFEHLPIPPNDLACGATFVNSPTFNDIVVGPAATADIDVGCNYNANPVQTTTGYGVWYRFMPTSAKQLTVHQNASDVLVYGLFTGPGCGMLTEIDCKMGNNGALTTDNTAYFNLSAGTEYWLLIGKISSSSPFASYNLTFTLADANGACCTGTTCTITTEAACTGTWRGAFTYCGETPNYEDAVVQAIPDHVGGNPGTPGVLPKTITITDSGTVSDLKVLVELTHARTGDLVITLTAPGGASAELMRRIDDDDDAVCPNNGSQGRLADLGGVYIFDDQSYNPFGPGIRAAAKYFDFTGLVVLPGHYKPSTCDSEVLPVTAPFLGVSFTGNWTLTVEDRQSSSTGTLQRWGLIINGGANAPCACRADFNGSGPPPTVQDIFDFLAAYFAGDAAADFNGSGSPPTVQDIFDFLAAYFAGC